MPPALAGGFKEKSEMALAKNAKVRLKPFSYYIYAPPAKAVGN
ncbi:hypothetical protein HNP37_002883 [Flavobacterium nitrogenifigens]|uniref:Uncharacterized protein n=2 Tax=Flavobacterium TaxID=237 RepID=A0A7W7IY92_9FLAO|nr:MULTISPECIES: hypothetical protein [Flavobacterium]MBB4802808.1 hypothetical protein [Flavobacterium nitrogenifigens]MBB6387766.1 hypothetical protein [Flavobacterium notoginsengisoli]